MNKTPFKEWLAIRWDNLSSKDKQFAVMNAWNAVGNIMEGSHIKTSEALKYAEEILVGTYQFEAYQRPMMKPAEEVANEEFDLAAEEAKKKAQPF